MCRKHQCHERKDRGATAHEHLKGIPVITADLPVSSTLSGNAYPMSIFKTHRRIGFSQSTVNFSVDSL